MAAATVADISKVVRKVIGEEQGDTSEATLKAVQQVIRLLRDQVIPRLPEAQPSEDQPLDEGEPDEGDEQFAHRGSYGLSGIRKGGAAARARSSLVASALEGYDATPETEHKLLEAELSNRVAELERYIPQDGASPSATMVKAIFDQSRELTQLAKEVVSRSGTRAGALEAEGEEGIRDDFTFPTYAEFLEDQQEVEARLQTDSDLEARGVGQLVSLLLSAFGIDPALTEGVTYALDEVAGGPWRQTLHYIKIKAWGRAAGSLKRVLNAMLSKRFRTALARKVGAKVAARVAARIASRFLPVIGWATFVVSFISAVAKRWGRLQSLPELEPE
jgi:hypothetical protein